MCLFICVCVHMDAAMPIRHESCQLISMSEAASELFSPRMSIATTCIISHENASVFLFVSVCKWKLQRLTDVDSSTYPGLRQGVSPSV